eukprot:3328203-Ditylum_brightwellii.AAC.1
MEGRDPMGRWLYTKYAAMNERVVAVVTTYQVCKSSSKIGTTTYHQQVVMLKQQNKTEDSWETLIKDLLNWLKIGHDKGEQFIVRGDYNDTLDIKT